MRPKDRETLRLDRENLARLAKQSTGEHPVVAPDPPVPDVPTSARTTTLSDPMTMALLAEVARSSRTRDFDPDEETTAEREPEQLAHPVLKRR